MRRPGTIAAPRRAVLPRCGGPRQSETVCSSENSLPTTISNADNAPELCCQNGKSATTHRDDAVRRSGDLRAAGSKAINDPQFLDGVAFLVHVKEPAQASSS